MASTDARWYLNVDARMEGKRMEGRDCDAKLFVFILRGGECDREFVLMLASAEGRDRHGLHQWREIRMLVRALSGGSHVSSVVGGPA